MKITYNCRGRRIVAGRPQRRGCGADLTPSIEALPNDGETHLITCEACGNQVSVVRPSTSS